MLARMQRKENPGAEQGEQGTVGRNVVLPSWTIVRRLLQKKKKEYYSAIKTENSAIVIRWVNMEGITLREISQQRKANTVWCHLYVESKKIKSKVKLIETVLILLTGSVVSAQ